MKWQQRTKETTKEDTARKEKEKKNATPIRGLGCSKVFPTVTMEAELESHQPWVGGRCNIDWIMWVKVGIFSWSLPRAFVLFHSVVQKRSDRMYQERKKRELKEKFGPWCLLDLCRAVQSGREVGVNVELSVVTQLLIWFLWSVEGRTIRLSRQTILRKHTGL